MRFEFVAACLLLSTVGSAQSPTVHVDAGCIIGTTTVLPTATAAVNKFLGIPFAITPPERFSPPERPAPYPRTINATAWKPACIQQFQYPKLTQEFTEFVFNNPPPQESEDCLYLNVYAPAAPAPPKGRAVMFWIYGGSLQFGNAGQPYYDGSAFAAYEDVIIVAPNYRTNVFGFPSSPELPLTGHNLGFLDQRMALDWVQRNIHAFGGDKDKVTIFGESAGAFSVDALVASYPNGTHPPFRAAILESGQLSYKYAPTVSAVPAWDNLTAALGCPGAYGSNLTCVRAASATTIQQIIDVNELTFPPIADNVTLVSDPVQRRAAGNIARVPILTGNNAQEGRVFAVGTTNVTEFLIGLGFLPGLIPNVLAAYPPGKHGLTTPYDIASAIFTDYIFQCTCALYANATAAIGVPTWRYYFNASFTNTQAYPDLGVYHSSEIPLVFRTYEKPGTTTQESALSQYMQTAWARFAKNPVGGPGWNRVGSGMSGSVLVGANSTAISGLLGNAMGQMTNGSFDLGVLGNRDNVLSAGVTVIDQSEVDYNCGLWIPLYEYLTGVTIPT